MPHLCLRRSTVRSTDGGGKISKPGTSKDIKHKTPGLI
jgi:hypothetical protein